MSLFPAFSGGSASEQQTNNTDEDRSWLTQSSFPTKPSPESDSGRCSAKQHRPHKVKKKKKKHDESKKRKAEKLVLEKAHEKMIELLSSDPSLYIDRTGSRNNFLIPTLMKTDVPKYKKPKSRIVFKIPQCKKKSVKWRYFNCSKKLFESDATVSNHLPAQTTEDILVMGNTETVSITQEMESQMSQTVASYNQKLTEDPHDEELWLKYVDLQDEIWHYEKQYKKAKENVSAKIEKKLSILAKALSHNPLSEVLLLRNLDVLSEINDLEKLSEELFSILRQDFGNMALWTRYIKITQCNVSRCTIPKVTSLYAQAMEKINFMQKHGILTTEIQLIDLFTSCALFLRQSGLWEQLCMLIRLNLQLNLSDAASDNYKVEVNLPEDEVKQLEDRILSCGLPIYSLWLRLEKLRQRIYWYPAASAECDDPQRVVVPTDVTDLIKPITTSSFNLRITFTALFLLKVPLIPLRDTVFRSLNLHQIPWHLDSAEVLLSAFGSIAITQNRFEKFEEAVTSLLKDLVTYPQYTNEDLGQAEFLDFIEKIFRKVSHNLPVHLETVILVWWLRFERTLVLTGKQSTKCKKRLKASVKELLKEERHRNNLPLYIEYALLEKELSKSEEACLKILETALLMHPLKKNVFHISSIRSSLTQLHRVTAEVLLSCGKKEECLRLLTSLALLLPEKEVKINEETIQMALQEYQRVTDEALTEDYTEEFELDQIRPQFLMEWAVCEAWFLLLSESVWSACAFIEELLRKFPRPQHATTITIETYYRELIIESMVTILHFHCISNKTSFNVLNEQLSKGIDEFPNNMLLLCTLSDLETKRNFVSPWWKIEKCLISNDSLVAKLVMILLCRKRVASYEQAYMTSIQILNKGSTEIQTAAGFNNRMRSLYLKLTKDKYTKQCPLIWMIYLQDCARYQSDEKYKDVFYMAVENCPWAKALYMEGAHVLLDQVSQIQDLMIEKEMRIHITNDEIEILRDS